MNAKFSEDNGTVLFLDALDYLYNTSPTQMVKGKETREELFATLILRNPQRSWLILPERKPHVFGSVFETLWVLSGTNSIESLSKILRRAKDFSDDGETWRAGYGLRLFRYGKGINQLDYCLDVLKEDPSTRQAVCSLWNPEEECIGRKTVDTPCSNHLQFLIRDGKLHCALTIRSNDLNWGLGHINLIEFTTIQRLMVLFLRKHGINVELGTYRHDARSLHIYPDYIKYDVEKVLKKYKFGDWLRFKSPIDYLDFLDGETSSHYSRFETLKSTFHTFVNFLWNERRISFFESKEGIEEISGYPRFIQDYLWTCVFYLYEDPFSKVEKHEYFDPNLKESLMNSWIPKNHLKPWKK